MDIKETVFKEFDSGMICVFPTEVLARNYLQEYARMSDRGMVFSSQAMAWDKFYQMFLPSHGDFRPSDVLTRRLFAAKFLASGEAAHLRHFSSARYGLAVDNLALYLAGILGQLQFGSSSAAGELADDVRVLLTCYGSFLERQHLYEKDFDLPGLENLPEGLDKDRYVICFPEAVRQYPLFVHCIGREVFRTVGKGSGELEADLEFFDNAMAEMKVQLRRIRALLDEGVNENDIAITCLGLDSCRAYLEREAALKGIRVSLVENLKLTGYSSGRFFADLKAVAAGDFSMASMQALLLNSSYPWKEPEVLRSLVRRGIEKRVISGRRNWTAALGNGREGLLFRQLSDMLDGFSRAATADELHKVIGSFQDNFFVPGAFEGTGELGKQVYSFCMRQLDRLQGAMADCGIDNLPGVFGVFVSLLESTPYVPQQQSPGIRVYKYSQSAGLWVRYHFVIGINQKTALSKVRYVTFLPDTAEKSFFADPVDTTDAVLALYSCSGENVRLSGAGIAFDGATLCPPVFLAQGRRKSPEVGQGSGSDEYEAELEFWAGDGKGFVPNPRQAEGFGTLRETGLEEIPVVPAVWRPVGSLSATMVDRYLKCPFAWLCQYGLEVTSGEYSPGLEDFRELGNLMHRVYEKFFMAAGVIEAGREEHYQKLLEGIFSEAFDEYAGQALVSEAALVYEKHDMWGKIRDGIKFDSLAGFSACNSEEKIQIPATDENWALEGRLDMIFKSEDGRYGVLDFKSGSLSAKSRQISMEKIAEGNELDSVQLLVYSRLLESRTGELASWSAYYSLKDGKLYFGWQSAGGAGAADELLSSKLSEVTEGIRSGAFEPAPGDDACRNCDYYCVCRKRFVVK